MSDWKQTPTLDAFAKMYDEDEHLWWRIGCGHHQNLYEAAVERYEKAEAAIALVRGIPEKESDVGYPNDWHIGWNACRESVLDALDGDA